MFKEKKQHQAEAEEITDAADVIADEENTLADAEAEIVENEAETPEAEETEEVDEAEQLRKQLEEQENKYLRLLADYDNFKRRSIKEREAAEKFRSQSLLVDLLPVLDNFERALAIEAKGDEAASLMKGVQMVHSSLLDAVKREGLEEVKALGEAFDPHVHQAVMQEKDESAEPGTVLQELQKGYTLKGRILRPAMVKVNE
ncbi:MAG TPA: nucleotide exchange factor GrpE [Planococcus sp. (in: firmicutes)]|nr:nucleotide exchange factor GrpE [Planococcus sp. (in: firmicutes)]